MFRIVCLSAATRIPTMFEGLGNMAFEKLLSELSDVNPSGEAPHKPLLLLTVLKAAERDGELPEVLLLSPELVY